MYFGSCIGFYVVVIVEMVVCEIGEYGCGKMSGVDMFFFDVDGWNFYCIGNCFVGYKMV